MALSLTETRRWRQNCSFSEVAPAPGTTTPGLTIEEFQATGPRNPAGLREFLWRLKVLWVVLAAGLAPADAGGGQEPTAILAGPTEAVAAGTEMSLWLHFLNSSAVPLVRAFPPELTGRISAGGKNFEVVLRGRTALEPAEAPIPPGGFVRHEYTVRLPAAVPEGQAVLEVPGLGAHRVLLDIRPPPPPAKPAEPAPRAGLGGFLREGLSPKQDFTPAEFFKQQLFGYEPFYFLGGWEAPEVKFQISLRYEILNREGLLAKKAPFLKGLNVAYTQTSLWDFGQLSSPFLDTSYKPEFFYLWQQVDRGRWAEWLRLDLQAGVQHESNGNPEIESRLLDIGDRVSYYVLDGADGTRIKTSRSLNILYFRPTFVFGKTNSLQLAVSPRVWAYVGDLNDNPDLPDYRGYADLRLTAGWAKGLQVSATGRLGDDANRGSVQVDLSYPLMKVLSGSFSVYLYAQYFNGYGESLLLYDRRSDALRFGLALYR